MNRVSGPITSTLEADVSRELRQRSLVIWLDKDGHYTPYVDQLAERYAQGDFFAPVIPFRGSYLETMLALESHGNKENPDLLLIHMPGHTEDTIRQTPILELYRAGKRYRKALDTLIREAATGKVSPDDIEGYLTRGATDLAQAETWLATALNKPQDDLSHYLDNLSLDWILDGLVGTDPTLKEKFASEAALPLLADHLHRYTGLDSEFITFFLGDPSKYDFTDLSDTFAAWLMCVEYVHDLARSPHLDELQPLTELSAPLRENCDRLINHLRDRSPDTYATIANATEIRLETEFQQISPEDLGKIDTFKQEETTVLEKGALAALEKADWFKALDWSKTRLDTYSFWLQRDPKRRIEWTLIRAMAELGTTIQQVGQPLEPGQTLQDVLEAYTESGYRVDLSHRRLEQQCSQLLESALPNSNALRNCVDKLRQTYRDWANNWAESFSQICEDEGFLPEPASQQRTLYDDVVHPLTQSDARVAYFLVDAFRYEMAAELLPELKESGSTPILKARYAELPTLTSVGMNVIAPVAKGGKLTLANGEFQGFKTGEFTVSKWDNRFRAMCDRSIDSANRRRAKRIALKDICEKSTQELKRTLSKVELVVINSQEIDKAGEANVGIVTFERWLQQLKSAWNHLKTIGFNEFTFTADHGFLLQDATTKNEHKWGKKTDPKRRHVLVKELRKEKDLTTVSLSALGYSGQTGYLLFPRNTDTFATGKAGATFVHGGNSLQERVIPVLTVSHRANSNRLKLGQYEIKARAKQLVNDFSCVQVKVQPVATPQGILSFTGAKKVNISLRVPNRPDIDVNLAEVQSSKAQLKNQQITVDIEQDWTDILFNLKGLQDERVKIEVYQCDGAEDVTAITLDTYFDVSGLKRKNTNNRADNKKSEKKEPKKEPQIDTPANWQDSFDDENIRDVFLHLYQHTSITEAELIKMLGNARKARRFALNFETHLQKVPFGVRVETAGSGKRYVKEA
ncbi:MAG: BREX-6 system phosphatase PglZ [Cyanobacteria bacterium J06555_13]